jgi:hypothetical protein
MALLLHKPHIKSLECYSIKWNGFLISGLFPPAKSARWSYCIYIGRGRCLTARYRNTQIFNARTGGNYSPVFADFLIQQSSSAFSVIEEDRHLFRQAASAFCHSWYTFNRLVRAWLFLNQGMTAADRYQVLRHYKCPGDTRVRGRHRQREPCHL